jgi:hypothetical protein
MNKSEAINLLNNEGWTKEDVTFQINIYLRSRHE